MMEQDLKQEARFRQYLLGELTLEEQVLVEQRLFLESEYAEMAQAVENDLVDDYLHDDLTVGERKKFEDRFLDQPEHRANLKIAEALKKYLAAGVAVDPSKVTGSTSVRPIPNDLFSLFRRRPVVSFSLATALLVIFSIIAWNVFKSMRSNRGEQPSQAKGEHPAKNQPTGEPRPAGSVNRKEDEDANTAERRQDPGRPDRSGKKDTRTQGTQQQRSLSTFATFEILPGGLSRSGGRPHTVRISPKLESVILLLPLDMPEHYDRYRYELLSGGRIVHKRELKSGTYTSGPIVSITLRAKLLNQKSYQINLRGIAADGRLSAPSTYLFNVERERISTQ
jgi:hypothetical protein